MTKKLRKKVNEKLHPNVAKVLELAKAGTYRLTPEEIWRQYNLDPSYNPLADYAKQITSNNVPKNAKLGDAGISAFQALTAGGLVPENLKYNTEASVFNYTKVILGAENRDKVLSQSNGAVRLFVYMLYTIGYSSDTIELQYEDKIASKTGIQAENTFRKAIDELCSCGILHRIGKKPKAKDYNLFHFNPQILFKGDSLGFYRNVIENHPEFTGYPTEHFQNTQP